MSQFNSPESSKARLSLVHVLENVPIIYGGGSFSIPLNLNLEDKLRDEARQGLNKLLEYARQQGVEEERIFLKMGSPKYGIIDTAQEIAADLIVLGSRSRRGLALALLGATANGVLHLAACDVYAVHMK